MGEAIKEIIKALKEMPHFLLLFFIAFICTTLFWFVGIFLFHKGFYNSNPILITIIFSVVLSIVWYAFSFYLTLLTVAYTAREKNPEMYSFVSGFTAFLGLIIGIGGCYLYKNYIDESITIFALLNCTFGYMIVMIVRAYYLFQKRHKMQKEFSSRMVDEVKKGLDGIEKIVEEAVRKVKEANAKGQ